MSTDKHSEMSREIRERLESDEWNRRMAESVLARVKSESAGDELSRRRKFRAVIAAAAASLLLSVMVYGAYDFFQPLSDDTGTSLGYLLGDSSLSLDDTLDSEFDTVALFD